MWSVSVSCFLDAVNFKVKEVLLFHLIQYSIRLSLPTVGSIVGMPLMTTIVKQPYHAMVLLGRQQSSYLHTDLLLFDIFS